MSNKVSRILEMPRTLGRNRTRMPFLLLVMVLGLVSPGAVLKAQTPPGSASEPPSPAKPAPPLAQSTAPFSDEYLISRDDVLDVYIYDVPELSHTYTVSPSGTVAVPLLPNPIQAAGLTADQFARAMEESFRQSGRLRRPEIAVSVRQSRTRSVAVEGAVKTPQVFPVLGRTNLVEVLTQCGGLADDAGVDLTITRGPLAMRDLAMGGGWQLQL